MAPPRLGQTRMSQRRFLRRGGDDSESSVEEPPSLADPPELSRLLPCMETIGGLTRENWLKWLHAVGAHEKIMSMQVFKMLLSLAQSSSSERLRLEATNIEQLWEHLKSIDMTATHSSECLTTKTFLEFMYNNNLFRSVETPGEHDQPGSVLASDRETERPGLSFLDTEFCAQSQTSARFDEASTRSLSNLSDFKRDLVFTLSSATKNLKKFKSTKKPIADKPSLSKRNQSTSNVDFLCKRISELENKVRIAEGNAISAERREKQALDLVKEHIQLYRQAENDLEMLSEIVKKSKIQSNTAESYEAMRDECEKNMRLLQEERQRNDLLQVKLRQKELECKELLQRLHDQQAEQVHDMSMSKRDLRSSTHSFHAVANLPASSSSRVSKPQERQGMWARRWRVFDSDSDSDASDSSEETRSASRISKQPEKHKLPEKRPLRAGQGNDHSEKQSDPSAEQILHRWTNGLRNVRT